MNATHSLAGKAVGLFNHIIQLIYLFEFLSGLFASVDMVYSL